MVKAVGIDLRVYPISAVRRGIHDFKGVCGILLQEIGELAVCSFDCQNGDFKEIRDEFCNYLIYAANKRDRVV